MVKYPEINIRLVGEDGNAFSILARVTQALRRAGISEDERKAFTDEATAGDYGHLLRTVMAWVATDEEKKNGYGCGECGELYAVGGCPACGDGLDEDYCDYCGLREDDCECDD